MTNGILILIAILLAFGIGVFMIDRRSIIETKYNEYIVIGDVYISIYSIESIFINDTDRVISIKTNTNNEYKYRFVDENSYLNYLYYLSTETGIDINIHNNF